MKSLYPFSSRVQTASTLKLSESLATNQTENLFKSLSLRNARLIILFCFFVGIGTSIKTFAQNAALSPGNIVSSNTTIYDRGGTGNYANYSNDWITVAGIPGATITIAGSYGLEACCDRIYIRNGYGNAGTALQTLSLASGTTTYTGTAGQTLTVHLTSDYSGVASGFQFTVTYSVAQTAPTILNLAGTTSTAACGSRTVVKDHAGDNTSYGNSRNDYIVFNGAAGSSAVLSIIGMYTTELNYDYLRVYNGVGTGGTIAYGPLSGAGTFNFTGVAGNTYTLQFTSDGSGVAGGFSLFASYTGTCTVTGCSGTPAPGNTIASSATVAPGGTVNLSLQTATSGTGVTYQWQSSTTSSSSGYSNISGATSSSYNATVTANTWYRCKVTCSGNTGTSTATQVTLTYCTPSTTYTGYYISNVVTTGGMSNLSNSSGTSMSANGYGDFTAQSCSNYPNSSISVATTINYGYGSVYVWVDWNNDLDFVDAGEGMLNSGYIYTYTSHVQTGSFTIPSSAPLGNYRMRIRYDYYSGNTSCGAISYGEAEDYTLQVVAAPACAALPSSLTSSVTSFTTATLSWTAASPAPGSGYDIYYSTSATAPVAGTAATTTTAAGVVTKNITGLTPNTTYYWWVRSNCNGTDKSNWVSGGVFSTLEGSNCAFAQDLSLLSSPFNGTTIGYPNSFTTTSGSCLTGTGGDRVFKIDVPSGGQLFIGQSVNDYDSRHRIAYGGSCPGTTEINTGYLGNLPTQTTNGTSAGCLDDNDLTHYYFNNTTGTTQTVYWIQDGHTTGQGTFTLEWLYIAPPEISTSGSLTAISTCSGSASTAQSFTVSGINLGASLVVTAPTGFEVSTTQNGTYTSSVSFTPSSGTVSSQTVWARLSATAVGSPSGNMAVSSTGGTTQNIAVSGTVNSTPIAVTVTGGAICSGGTITATGGTGGTIYWQGTTSGGTGTTFGSGTTSPAITAAGTYYARAKSSAGCWGTEGSASVTLIPIPLCISAGFIPADASSSVNPVSGTTISWSAVTNATSYDVYFGTDNAPTNIVSGANQSGLSYVTGSLYENTTYYWKIVPKNCNGSASNCPVYSFTTTASCTPPTISSTSNVNINCFNQSTGSITVNAMGGVTGYAYSKDNGTTWQSSNVFGSLSVGSYTIVVKGGDGCIGAPSVVALTQPAAALSVSASGSGSGCEGSTLSLTSSVSGGTSPYSYSWSNAGGLSSGAVANPTATIGSFASHTLTVTDANGCTASSSAVTITNNSPAAPTVVTPAAICQGQSANLNATSSGNSINWYTVSSGGTALASLVNSGANYSVSPLTTATYYAEAVVTNAASQTFNFTGANQTWSVPAGVTEVTISAWGAEGGGATLSGNTNSGNGGKGGYSTGKLAVTPGQTLNVYVGGFGASSTSGLAAGGWNGGGSGYASSAAEPGNGGGGASDVRLGGTSLSDRVVVAGGGGGGGEDAGDSKGNGGGLTGTGYSGYDASQTAAGTNGQLGIGASTNLGDGGGGGGGYYGGGTTQSTSIDTDTQGGGGGSGFIGGVTSSSTIDGELTMPNPAGGTMVGNSGNGKIIFTFTIQGCASTRTPVTVTVNEAPTATAGAALSAICQGQTSAAMGGSIGGTATSGTWSGGAGTWNNASNYANATYTSGASESGTITLTLTPSGGSCPSVLATKTIVVNANPSTLTLSPLSASICNGSTQSLLANGGNIISTGTSAWSGTGTTLTSSTGYPTAFGNYWYQDWNQFLYTASELTAMGMTAGNITSLSFKLGALPSPTAISNYSINLANSNLTSLSGFVTTGFTTVFSSASYTVAMNASNAVIITFSAPYYWDGTSNIVVDVRGTGAYGSANATTEYTTTTNNSVVSAYTSAINASFWTSSPTATTSTSRPNVRFGGQISAAQSITWSPVTALFTDDATTTAYAGTSAATVYAKPTATTTYTTTATSAAGCTSSSSATVTVNQPSVAPTAITGTTTICNGSNTTLTANGTLGTGASYEWGTGSTVGTNPIAGETSASITVSPTSSITYWVRITGTTSPCTGTTSGTTTTVTVNQPSVAPTSISGTTTICNGASTTLSAVGATLGTGATYEWGTGSTVGSSPIAGTGSSITVTPTAITSYWVRLTGTSPCPTTTDGVTTSVTVNALPTAVTVSGGGAICAGTSATLTADNGSSGTIYWQNTTSGGTSTTTASASQSVSAAGTYHFRAQSAELCWGTEGSATVTVTSLPSTPVVTVVDNCNGTSTLSTTATGTLLWSTTETTSPITVSTADTYTVTQTANGCTSASGSGVAAPKTTPATPSVSVTNACGLSTLVFTPAANATILWSDGGTSSSTTTSSNTTLTVVQTVNECPSSAGSGSAVPLVIPSAPVAAAAQNFCVTDNATVASLAYTNVAGNTYTWYDAATAGNTVATSTQLPTATTSYYLSVSGSNGCTSLTRTLVAATESAQALATVSIIGTSACPGGEITFTATPSYGGNSPTYQWYNGGVPILNATGNTYIATGLTEGDLITVKMIPSGSCVTVCPN